MFHALMERFQLELFIFITYFFHRRPTHKLYFLSCRAFFVNATSQETEEASKPYKTCCKCRVNDERPTGNKIQLVSGTTVEKIGNKNK